MSRRSRYLALLLAAVFVVTLMLALPTTVLAKVDVDNGNHQAIWYFHVDQYGNLIECGEDWGDTASDWASTTEHKGGVSEGVHYAKDHQVPGQNK